MLRHDTERGGGLAGGRTEDAAARLSSAQQLLSPSPHLPSSPTLLTLVELAAMVRTAGPCRMQERVVWPRVFVAGLTVSRSLCNRPRPARSIYRPATSTSTVSLASSTAAVPQLVRFGQHNLLPAGPVRRFLAAGSSDVSEPESPRADLRPFVCSARQASPGAPFCWVCAGPVKLAADLLPYPSIPG
jgi:hypothetical protein